MSGFFATDLPTDILRPVNVGERLGARGRKLLFCERKKTRVGRGAFCKFESEIVSNQDNVVHHLGTGTYVYSPYSHHGALA